MNENDMVLNWTNTLQKSERGAQIVAAQAAASYHEKRYAPQDALELMLADGLNERLAQSAIEGIWGNYRFADNNDGGTSDGSATIVTMVPIVPVEYRDVLPIVEDQLLRRLSAREFVNRLCRTAQPIIPVGQKDLNSLYELTERAADNDHAMRELHSVLAPFFETTMLKNVEASQEGHNAYRVAEFSAPRAIVASENRRNATVECDLETGRCACAKFTDNHYGDFGIACEHLIHAVDTISPMERLKRPFVG